MRVLLTPEAAAMLESRKRWWRANRPATADIFEHEFMEAVTLIGERASLLPVALEVRGRTIRRVLMEETACHLYYEIDEGAGSVWRANNRAVNDAPMAAVMLRVLNGLVRRGRVRALTRPRPVMRTREHPN